MAKLLQRAGIDFAILGPSENCTGDPARRSGNEYIFQMLAMQNIETLNGMGVKKIITQCPHCFNTLMNEYPQLGGNYEVVHHSQFLEWLIDQGKLDLADARLEERIVYHDSCYLGRHNDVYLAPRSVIGQLGGIEIVEAPRNGTKGMCCGAGGARMWMEETIGTKVNDARSEELIATGASRIATACPFCYIMIDDGVKGLGKEEDEVKVADISMHLLEAIEKAEAAEASGPEPDDRATDPRLSREERGSGAEVLPVAARRGAALALVLRAERRRAVRDVGLRRHDEEGDLTDLHAGIDGDRQGGDVRQLERDVAVPPGVDEPGRRVDQQPEATQARLALQPTDQIVGQPDALVRRAEDELARVQDELRVGVVGDLHQLGEILHVLFDVDDPPGVVPEHPEVAVARQVDRGRLDPALLERVDLDAPFLQGLTDAAVGEDHGPGRYPLPPPDRRCPAGPPPGARVVP